MELRIFISSTFRDLHREREVLLKQVFPKIRALCRERGISLTEIDLRWGLTDEEVKLGGVMRACLDEVDRCRPYFIGITGSRYGYVPSLTELHKDPRLLVDFPWLEDAVIDGMSITEIEAHYALLGSDTGKPPCSRARFYLREDNRRTADATEDDPRDADDARQLASFRSRIRQSGAPVATFRDPAALGTMVYDDLVATIDADFAAFTPPSALDEERARHDAFSMSRRRAYIPNRKGLSLLDEHAHAGGPPLVLFAESGSGKSSLLAYWAERFRRRNPGVHVIEHYVGIGSTAVDHYGVIRHFCMEVAERFGRTEEIPSEPGELAIAFGLWLGYADDELQRRDERMVVALDGLDQLQAQEQFLRWMPDVIAPRIRLLLSSTNKQSVAVLRRRGWQEYQLPVLEAQEREAIIVRYLAEFHKSLNNRQIEKITDDAKSGHPLFLKTLLEELRLVPRHEDLDRTIDTYLGVADTEQLFQMILGRIEADFPEVRVDELLGAIALSRTGLAASVIAGLCDTTPLQVSELVASLDFHLVRKQGRLTFFHSYLRRAVKARYLGTNEQRTPIDRRFALYFAENDRTTADHLELIAAYQRLGETDRLVSYITAINTALSLYRSDSRFELLTIIKEITDDGIELTPQFEATIERRITGGRDEGADHPGSLDAGVSIQAERLTDLTDFIGLMRSTGQLGIATATAYRALALAEEIGNVDRIARLLCDIGILESQRSNYDVAREHFDRSRQLYEEGEDRKGLAATLLAIGRLAIEQKEMTDILPMIERATAIFAEAQDERGISGGERTIGEYFFMRGEHARARTHFAKALVTAERIGDRFQAAKCRANIGIISFNNGDFAQAIAEVDRAREIVEGLGDRVTTAVYLGNLGRFYMSAGSMWASLSSTLRAIAIHREAEALRPLVIWLNGITETLCDIVDTGDREGTLLPGYLDELFAPLAESSESVDRRGLLLAEANVLATEAAATSSLLGDVRNEFKARLALCTIDAMLGNGREAATALQTMLADAAKEQPEARLYRSASIEEALYKATDIPAHRDEALAHYRAMYAAHPTPWIAEKIAKLS